MDAMILHSDNIGTDIVLKEAGVANVRKFIASLGLKNTMIPDSTRILAAYLLGAPNYLTITWDELVAIPPGPLAHPFLNNVETLASTAADLVSFFSRALQEDFSLLSRDVGGVQKNSFPRRHQLPGPVPARHLDFRQGRLCGCRGIARPFDRWGSLLPQTLGLLFLRAQLGC